MLLMIYTGDVVWIAAMPQRVYKAIANKVASADNSAKRTDTHKFRKKTDRINSQERLNGLRTALECFAEESGF